MDVKIKTERKTIGEEDVKAIIVEAGNSYFETYMSEDEEVDITVDNSNDDIHINVEGEGSDDVTNEEPEYKIEGEVYNDRVVVRLINSEGEIVREMNYSGEVVKLVKGLTYLSSFTSAII
jgi:hypothetical protein